MDAPTEGQVRNALEQVMDPELNHSLVKLGLIQEIEIVDGSVHVDIQLTTPHCPFAEEIVARIRSAIMALEGVSEVHVDRECSQHD